MGSFWIRFYIGQFDENYLVLNKTADRIQNPNVQSIVYVIGGILGGKICSGSRKPCLLCSPALLKLNKDDRRRPHRFHVSCSLVPLLKKEVIVSWTSIILLVHKIFSTFVIHCQVYFPDIILGYVPFMKCRPFCRWQISLNGATNRTETTDRKKGLWPKGLFSPSASGWWIQVETSRCGTVLFVNPNLSKKKKKKKKLKTHYNFDGFVVSLRVHFARNFNFFSIFLHHTLNKSKNNKKKQSMETTNRRQSFPYLTIAYI